MPTPGPARFQPRHARALAAIALLAALAASCTPLGCARAKPWDPTPSSHADATIRTMTVRADWDDIRAAIDLAVGRVEMAVLDGPDATDLPASALARYDLLTITDESAWIEFSRNPASAAEHPRALALGQPWPSESITLRAHVGSDQPGTSDRPESRAWAQRLLDAVARRLSELAGVATAPAR